MAELCKISSDYRCKNAGGFDSTSTLNWSCAIAPAVIGQLNRFALSYMRNAHGTVALAEGAAVGIAAHLYFVGDRCHCFF